MANVRFSYINYLRRTKKRQSLCRCQLSVTVANRSTRQLSYRKDDRAMRPIYGILRDSWKFSGHPYIERIARSSLRLRGILLQ